MISPSIQLDEITRYAIANGFSVEHVYEDIDITGRTDARPGLQALLAAAHEADAVIVYRLDRFTREPLHYYQMVHALTAAGVELHDAGESRHEASPESDFMRGIKVLIAKQESRNIGRRAEATHRRLAKLGRWYGGPVPFGWRRVRDADGPRLEVAEDEAHWRRWMHERYAEGASCHEIARRLNTETHARPRSGGWWSNGIVRAMLIAPIQVGARESDGELVRGGNIAPLLSEDTYARTLALMPARSRHRGPSSPHAVPTALFACGNCGGPMTIYYSRGRACYHCRGVARGTCAHGVVIDAAAAVAVVEAAVLARVRRMRPGKPHQRPAVPTRAREAGVTLARARDAVARLSVMYAGGELAAGEYQDALALAREQVKQAEAALKSTEQATEQAVARDTLDSLWAELHRITPDAWAAMTVASRRQIVGLLVERVAVSPGRLSAAERCDIEWRLLR